MAKLIYDMSSGEWVCSECGETYTRVGANKAWGGMTASIRNVESLENKDKFIGGYCTACGNHWDSWEINDTPKKIEHLKCKYIKCPENRNGYCSLGVKPPHLVLTKDNKVKIIKNNS